MYGSCFSLVLLFPLLFPTPYKLYFAPNEFYVVAIVMSALLVYNH